MFCGKMFIKLVNAKIGVKIKNCFHLYKKLLSVSYRKHKSEYVNITKVLFTQALPAFFINMKR